MEQGIVIFTDGGCRPSRGFGGWGIHGYLYSTAVPKKGSGNSDFVLTSKGYVLKSISSENKANKPKEYLPEVTPISYLDGCGSFNDEVTNNIAELTATTQGLIYAEQFVLSEIQIFTDSEHVCKGLASWAESWKKNGWLKNDGQPPANVEYWKTLVEIRDRLVSKGVKVKVDWVSAHTDDVASEGYLGNFLADKLATLGVMYSKAHVFRNDVTTSAADGYWKYSPERHPFLNNRRMYFNTFSEFIEPGEYYLGEHGKDDDMIGKRVSDGAHAVVKLETPDPVIEMIRAHQSAMSGNIDTLIMLRVDQLFKPDVHKELAKHGSIAMVRPNPYALDLYCLDKEPLTHELSPVKTAMRVVDTIGNLSVILTKYLSKDAEIVTTDLTPVLYEVTTKTSKNNEVTEILKLKPEYTVGFAALKIDANYKSVDGTIKSAPITLTLGQDVLDRNALKRLEERNPKVTLVTWLEDAKVFRYATVIEAGPDKGIWGNCYANLRLISTDKTIK